MTDVKRIFQSNRRFDRYGRPKESLFEPQVLNAYITPTLTHSHSLSLAHIRTHAQHTPAPTHPLLATNTR